MHRKRCIKKMYFSQRVGYSCNCTSDYPGYATMSLRGEVEKTTHSWDMRYKARTDVQGIDVLTGGRPSTADDDDARERSSHRRRGGPYRRTSFSRWKQNKLLQSLPPCLSRFSFQARRRAQAILHVSTKAPLDRLLRACGLIIPCFWRFRELND